MFDEQRICPYTGLRSFTEEESIYFKGRDEHIDEATSLLEKNKFLMLTGASGDGKSSLVYAGIVPNAKAGFLKSHYSNWVVADFRPERSPFDNLTESLAKALQIQNSSTVKSELSYGFSALVDLYKNSKFYVNKQSEDYQNLSESDQSLALRNGANLLILADQFEEFFTNPENYHNGVTSQESNLVVNLLLETAHLALEYNLPIYVVCTMRSDYIGQCAAFRGLPEYIGFSQFFVPRLNRKQLNEVVEEPAILSGNRISARLVERLIYDITDGIDQLPILQHALREIWKMASNGEEEMDLIHYAKVGGLKAEELPEEDKAIFNQWFSSLPAKIRECYGVPSHYNVLNTHANKLLVTARDYTKEHYQLEISKEDTEHIIHNCFVCLTKIDHSRAVRNRMSLIEITRITDIPGLTADKVKKVINIYRDSENTLIKPFFDNKDEDKLEEVSVLDITHESLIRNWKILNEWAHEEFENLTIYNDFKQQLDRWIENEKSSDYLLPVGPLTYFESWFNDIQPNKYWIYRYNEGIEDPELRLADSEKTLNESLEFLKKSDRKHFVTRAITKHGFRKIGVILAVIAIVTLSSFFGIEKYRQSNSFVYNQIRKESLQFMEANDVDNSLKGNLAIELIRRDPENFSLIFNKPEKKQSFLLAQNIAEIIGGRDQRYANPLLDTLISAELSRDLNTIKDFQNSSEKLSYYNNVVSAADYLQVFREEPFIDDLKSTQSRRLYEYLKELIDTDTETDNSELAIALTFILNSNDISDEEKRGLVQSISPFESDTPVFQNSFASGNLLLLSFNEYGADYGGLYQILASYYAYFGNYDLLMQSIDSLLTDKNSYYSDSYYSNLVEATNVSYYLFKKDQELFKEFVTDYCRKEGIDELAFYSKLLRKGIISAWYSSIASSTEDNRWYYNRNLDKMPFDDLLAISKIYQKKLEDLEHSDEKLFELALMYKLLGVHKADYEYQSNLEIDYSIAYPYFDTAFYYYNKISDAFLDQATVLDTYGIRSRASKRSIFLYPDVMNENRTWDPRQYDFIFNNASFLSYLSEKNLIGESYDRNYLINMLEEWTLNYWVIKKFGRPSQARKLLEEDQDFLKYIVNNENLKGKLQLPVIVYSLRLFENNRSDEAILALEEINLGGFSDKVESPYGAYPLFQAIGFVNSYLVMNNRPELASKIINSVGRPGNISSQYGFIAYNLGKNGQYELSKIYLDSAAQLFEEVRSEFQPNRTTVTVTRLEIPEQEQQEIALEEWKNSSNKWPTERYMTLTYGESNRYFEAYSLVDPLFPNNRKANRYLELLYSSRMSMENPDNTMAHFDENTYVYLQPIAVIQ